MQRTLAQGQASDRALVEVQESLARESEESLVLRAMMGDRATAYDTFQRLVVGSDQTDNGGRFEPRGRDDPGYDLGYRLWVEEGRGRPPEG
jgi:hypothetical protein